ncbi:hypothetical protein ABT255_07785 [Streptomyces mirabilis]|uniref:hypothetical protein n=1 Tax=Streptomyces mirabilis TaxID=68239 RepID=UPI00333334BB
MATSLDLEMLQWNIHIAKTPIANLPKKSGVEVYEEIGHRQLIRFLTPDQNGAFRKGSGEKHFTTPTPYPADEVIEILHLPGIDKPRLWALILDPRKIPTILGPRLVRWGFAVEYVLPDGFPQEALIESLWEVRVS